MIKLWPFLFIIFGGSIGSGAGLFLKPSVSDECEQHTQLNCDTTHSDDEKSDSADTELETDYVAMKNQFVVPIVKNELVSSLVVMSLSLETAPENVQQLFDKEPKLRDAFLRVMFDHSYIGGFDGAFTESRRMSALRSALLETARSVAGSNVLDVLITDIARQEM